MTRSAANEQWTCPHGTTYTGSADFVSGARNAHDEIAGWMRTSEDGGRSTNDIAHEIIQVAPQVEALVEEWFAVESRARVRMLEAAHLSATPVGGSRCTCFFNRGGSSAACPVHGPGVVTS